MRDNEKNQLLEKLDPKGPPPPGSGPGGVMDANLITSTVIREDSKAPPQGIINPKTLGFLNPNQAIDPSCKDLLGYKLLTSFANLIPSLDKMKQSNSSEIDANLNVDISTAKTS